MSATDKPTGGDYSQLVEPLVELCRHAGKAIVGIYQQKAAPSIALKADSSPVTDADHLAHDILLEGLQKITPGWLILSEEQALPSFEERRQWHRYWLVDPLDGTREFLKRTGEFTINIALIENGVAVLGVIGVPLEDAVYAGEPGYGAWRYSQETIERLSVSPVTKERVRILTGGHRGSEALAQCRARLARVFSTINNIKAGSALKFCRLAEGRGDIYPRFSPCCEWDTAAGQALLEGAGGQLVDLHFQPLRYNRKKSVYSPHFYATAGQNVDWKAILTPSEGTSPP